MSGWKPSGGIFDCAGKQQRLNEVRRLLAAPDIWNEPERARQLGSESGQLARALQPLDELSTALAESDDLIELALEEDDTSMLADLDGTLDRLTVRLNELEWRRMFSGRADSHNAFLSIQAGSGGTEAQDWAEMLLRMYLRWGERNGFKTEVTEASAGETAGIKSATVYFVGDYAYGWLRTETGIHRLVRKSPFDSGNRRHTSFASVFASPEVDDDIDIQLDPSELRVDTYRASGAGGQHVNKTDSAVRITHVPTGLVVQCQNDRSQHRNRERAMRQIRAGLYELELQKRRTEQQAVEDNKADITWGRQIRSYVLDQSRIKDLRTSCEISNTQAVLDGDLTPFMEACLKQGV